MQLGNTPVANRIDPIPKRLPVVNMFGTDLAIEYIEATQQQH